MAPPVRSQALSEPVEFLGEFLLFLDPWRHKVLLLDHLVHEVLGGIHESAICIMIRFGINALAPLDIGKVSLRYGILDSFVRERREALKGYRHGSSIR